jgi:hypothetical protein
LDYRSPGMHTAVIRLTRLSLAPLAALIFSVPTSHAGEISGLPPHLLPSISADYSFFLGNDFLAAGTNDDFRTQQLIATANIRKRWVAVLDHSMLTRADAVSGPPARLDLMSLSLGYKFIDDSSDERSQSLTVGTGVRGAGNYEGGRIQNGFHTLIVSGTSFLPYATTRQTDATLWFASERYQLLRSAQGSGLISGWDAGYWAKAGGLATSDGQFDGVAGLYAVLSRPGYDLWAGVRRDWREGYSADIVQIETAAEESKTAFAYGVRLGSLVIETVQRFGSRASYGQLSFVSSAKTRKEASLRPTHADVQIGLYIPHMMFQLAARLNKRIFTSADSDWQESVLVDLRGGQPQLGHDVTRFTETAQLTAGLEFSRQISDSIPWLRFYGAGAVGWRSEKLIGRGDLAGVRSDAIGKAVLQADVGLEIDTVRLSSNWRHKLRFGLSGWAPAESVTVMDGGMPSELHKPGASIAVVWTFNYH